MNFTDPEILYGQLAAGDVGRITAAADPVTAAMSALERAKTSINTGTTTATGGWEGPAASAFGGRARLSDSAAQTARQRLETAVRTVQAAATAYGTMRRSADEAIQLWRSQAPRITDPAVLRQLASSVNNALITVRDGYENTLRAYARSLDGVSPAFAEVAGGTSGWQQTTPESGLTVPPRGSDPRAVAQWWAGLSQAQRDQLMATEFDQLGRLRGLPAGVLDEANRRRIELDQTRYETELADVDAQLNRAYQENGIEVGDEGALRERHPELADLLDRRQELDRMLENANGAQANVERADAQGIPGGVHVLSYDPLGPGQQDGLLAVAFGNPDTADHVALTVPGMTTEIGDNFPAQAADLRRQMDAVSPDTSNATIAWLGYDAPTLSTVAGPEQAQQGAELLVADVDGYRAAAEAAGNTDQHLTAIGHSYGSTTVGYAGMEGLAADDVAFIGSPGVGASDADQLTAGSGHVWAGTTEHDPVVRVTDGDWFTADGSDTGPYDKEFGANLFGASDDSSVFGAHTSYYDPGSESLRNLGNIATGNYGEVTPHRPDTGFWQGLGDGLSNTGGHLLDGEWGEAWQELTGTGGEALNDLGDGLIGLAGEGADFGRDVWNNTAGRIF